MLRSLNDFPFNVKYRVPPPGFFPHFGISQQHNFIIGKAWLWAIASSRTFFEFRQASLYLWNVFSFAKLTQILIFWFTYYFYATNLISENGDSDAFSISSNFGFENKKIVAFLLERKLISLLSSWTKNDLEDNMSSTL